MITQALEPHEHRAIGAENERHPAISRRWIVLVIAAIAYGSLIPFATTLSSFSPENGFGLLNITITKPGLEDLVTNLLLYIPFGITCQLAIAGTRRPQVVRLLNLTILALALSLVLETIQTGIRGRVGSWIDIGLNTFSAMAGFVIALGFRPVSLLLWRQLAKALAIRPYRILWLAAAVAVIALALAPFDFVTSTQALHDSFRRATLSWTALVDLIDRSSPTAVLFEYLRGGLAYAVVAYLGVLAATERGCDLRAPQAIGVVHSLIFVVLVEMMQLFTRSRVFDAFDIAAGFTCSLIGLGAAGLVVKRLDLCEVGWSPRKAFPTPLLLGLLVTQVVLVVGPTAADVTEFSLARVWRSLPALPFESLWRGSMTAAVHDIVEQLVGFGLIGLCVAIILRRSSVATAWLISSVLVGTMSIMVSGLNSLATHGRLDLTNVILAVIAVLLVSRVYPAVRPVFVANRSTSSTSV